MSSALSNDDEDYDPSILDHDLVYTQRSGCLKTGKGGYSRRHNSATFTKVHFGHVIVREYGMILGANPAVSHGAPVEIDWEPQEVFEPIRINEWEQKRELQRALDKKDLLMTAHKRCKILFAAGYTIDEIAKATMDMKESRQLRAESLKSQGLFTNATGAIWELLSGAAEHTGKSVRKVHVLPGAVVEGTMKAVTEFSGLTGRVINVTAKGTGTIIKGTGQFVFKGTTGVVKGTSRVVVGTGKVATDVVMGTGKAVFTGATGVVKGTGLIFAGTGRASRGLVKATSKRFTNLVNQDSNRNLIESPRKNPKGTVSRGRLPVPSTAIPVRQRSFDNSRTASFRCHQSQLQGEDVYDERSMERFLSGLPDMEPTKVKAVVADMQLHTRSLH